ncbi:MAG TPA: sulfatase-like hydrolase/transferase, partial [Spirochaetota bacterium]|nr:sulfatase-like hydrolase/transferase [Spirochaetota bacterium]
PLWSLGVYGVREYPRTAAALAHIRHIDPALTAGSPGPMPDIYYIIADGYGRSDMLRELYSIDNSEFIRWLGEKGFYVARESCSNYCMTFMSLASSLNMQYLNYLGTYRPPGSPDRMVPYTMMHDPGIVRVMKKLGYEIAHLGTTYTGTETLLRADRTIDNRSFITSSGFVIMLTHTTVLKFFERYIDTMIARQMLRNLDAVAALRRRGTPLFAFVHLLVPHPPFHFDSAGNIRTQPPKLGQFLGREHWHSKKQYADQLTFLNTRLKSIITAILKQPGNPVIILQADHGTGSSWSDPEAYRRERFPILNAYYCNDAMRKQLYPSISPVNSFRVLLNSYFGAKLPLLPDRRFFSKITSPFDLTPVGRGR